MKEIKRTLTVKGNYGEYTVNAVTTEDHEHLMHLYQSFRYLTNACRETRVDANGKEKVTFRGINLPEALSERAFMLATGAVKILEMPKGVSSSCDCYNTTTDELVEVKSSWIDDDLTSFSPKNNSDVVYFQDFSAHDGTFNIYRLDYSMFADVVTNKSKNETFKDQQKQGKRPRLSLKNKVIRPLGLEPVLKGYIFQRENFFLKSNVGGGMLAKAKARATRLAEDKHLFNSK